LRLAVSQNHRRLHRRRQLDRVNSSALKKAGLRRLAVNLILDLELALLEMGLTDDVDI